MNKVITSVAEMYMDEDDILRMRILPGADITLDKVKENYEASLRLLNGRKALVLTDGTAEYTISDEAKHFSAGPEASAGRIAVAYLTRSVTNKLMFNLYLKIYAPLVPTKMFSSEDAALRWLRSFYVMPGEKFVRKKK
ncbi:MAG: hypothetical protein ACJ77K_05950 [Bacteroidia bacterium]